MIFGLAALPLIMAGGAAVDYSRASDLLTRLQAGTDATVLTICQTSASVVTADLNTQVLTSVQSYLGSKGTASLGSLTLTNAPRTASLTTTSTYPTAFMKMVGQNTIPVSATAGCTGGEVYYEIALVLDTTGSMLSSAGGVSKMQALKTAATNFVNYMFTTVDTSHLKIAVVPFAGAAKVDPITYASANWLDLNGKSSLHWQNVSGAAAAGFKSRFDIFKKLSLSYAPWSWAGCLESLPYPLNVSDVAPSSSNPDSYYVPLFAPDEIGNNKSSNNYNSYLDDGTLSTGACNNNSGSDATRMGQACKYALPKNIDTTSDGPNFMCPGTPLMRLTTNQIALLGEISGLVAYGGTNIHEGLMWGWRTLSPNSVFADGAPYTTSSSTKNVKKIILLMTDGENQWLGSTNQSVTSSFYAAYGYFTNVDGSKPNGRLPPANANPTSSTAGRAAIDALTREACTNINNAGISVYTVAFSTPGDPIDAQGQAILSNCASTVDKAYVASDSSSLQTAFSSIAQGIGALRITK